MPQAAQSKLIATACANQHLTDQSEKLAKAMVGLKAYPELLDTVLQMIGNYKPKQDEEFPRGVTTFGNDRAGVPKKHMITCLREVHPACESTDLEAWSYEDARGLFLLCMG
eukprot:2825772-Lingulodinium_polyedra.AAC.1